MIEFKTRIKSDQSGATLIEFSLILPILLAMTMGILEFGYVLHQFNNAQKATQAGARMASSRNVLDMSTIPDCFVATNLPAGTDCAGVGLSGAQLTTPIATCTGAGGSGCITEGAADVLAEMQIYYPGLTASNVEFVFTPTNLGFVGRRRPVPAITVKVKDLTYNYIAIGGIIKAMSNGNSDFGASLGITEAQTTIIAEDLSEGASAAF